MSVNVGSYCDSTITKRVTLESFMKHVNFLNDKEKILRLWIGRVVPYLLSHHTNSKRQVGARLKTLECSDQKIIIDRELQIVCSSDGRRDLMLRQSC